MTRENLFRKTFTDTMRGLYGSRCYIHKHHGNVYQGAGLPDLFVAHQDWGQSFLELKAIDEFPVRDISLAFDWRKHVTALQNKCLMDLASAGVRSGLLLYVHPVKNVLAFTAHEVDELWKGGAAWSLGTLKDKMASHRICVDWAQVGARQVGLRALVTLRWDEA